VVGAGERIGGLGSGGWMHRFAWALVAWDPGRVLLWFAGLSFAIVWVVFRSPAIDYRFVVIGALIPLVDLVGWSPPVAHTVLAAAVSFGLVVALTPGRRLRRRRWLGIPIGWFLHLVLDGTWADAGLFWWPMLEGGDVGRAPELGRPVVVLALLEVIGLITLRWVWKRFELAEPSNRRALLREGRLLRSSLLGPGGSAR
jgi:hypothetical protein